MPFGEKDYRKRVIQHFKEQMATEEQWNLLGEIFNNASGLGELENFDLEILSQTEFCELYEIPLSEYAESVTAAIPLSKILHDENQNNEQDKQTKPPDD